MSGESLSLESDAVGKPAVNPDISFVLSDRGGELIPSNGSIVKASQAVTASHCRTRLAENEGPPTVTSNAGWYCITTSAGHLAAVQVVTVNGGMTADTVRASLLYMVWNVPA